MDESYNKKYQRVLEILPDVTECAQGRLILVGGTALTIFYLNHRASVDLDFDMNNGNDVKLKKEIKGCLSKKGYRTTVGAFENQLVVQFEDTSIKVEIFESDIKIKVVEDRIFANKTVKVASLNDLFQMKVHTYGERKGSA